MINQSTAAQSLRLPTIIARKKTAAPSRAASMTKTDLKLKTYLQSKPPFKPTLKSFFSLTKKKTKSLIYLVVNSKSLRST